ncbi:hypothetical protein OKA04_21395 [Luteolibacter flavescens]|uniref:Tetratricopeptide repeat protein n=1 Tax=Luteolibacter flavescens TaxID=1859460 RepID=A0ABT3FUQ0_9BACT|nr:hypothetical protein [Luteolibacter flavescens]MCW1887307.1 hypothetical protein [Luteolibacter flavescens]
MSFVEKCHDRWADLHPFWRFLTVTTVVAGIAFVAGKPAIGFYRGWQDDRRFADAVKADQAGNHAEVRELALAVLRRDAGRKEAIPLLLRATEALGDPRRIEVALSLLMDKTAAADERLFAWNIVRENVPAWILQVSWSGLEPEVHADPRFVAPLIDRMLWDGMSGEALATLDSLKSPLPPDLASRRMKVLVSIGTDQAYDTFQRELVSSLPQLPSDSEVVALLDDVPQKALRPDLHRAFQQWMQKSDGPTSGVEMEFRLIRCQMAAEPESADEIFTSAFARHGESHPLETARWCLQVGRYPEADGLLGKLGSTGNEESFQLRLRALEELKQFDRYAEVLASPPSGTSMAWVQCETAFAAENRQDAKAPDSAAEAALRAAKEANSGKALIELARQAEKRGLQALAQRSWLEAIRRGPGPLPLASSLKSLIEGLAEEKKETELFEVLATYRSLEPGNPVVIVQHDYLACLLGRMTPETVVADLEPIHTQFPDALPAACTLALAHLLLGESAKAESLTNKEIDWFAANPSYRAIRGLALQGRGNREEALVFFEDFPWDDLLPSEKKVLSELNTMMSAPPLK